MSNEEILDLIHTNYSTMDKIEYAVSMRQLSRNSESDDDYDIEKHPGFHVCKCHYDILI